MRFFLYSSHYMYLGHVTFLHTLYLLYIYKYICVCVCACMMYVFHLYLTCVVSFLSLFSCFFFYITRLHFTLDALMDFFFKCFS